jgi:hypothetical protein
MVTGSAQLGPLSDCTANCRPVLSSERASHRGKTATFRKEVISGRKSQSGLDTKTLLTDRPSVVKLGLLQKCLHLNVTSCGRLALGKEFACAT